MLPKRKTARYRSVALILSVAQVLCAMGTGCSHQSVPPTAPFNASAAQTTQSLGHRTGGMSDGEQLYRGVMFGQGSIVSQVPELEDILSWRASLPTTELASIDAFADSIVAAIGATNTSFFGHFSAEIRSGDHYRISAVLSEGSQMMLTAMDAIPSLVGWRTRIVQNSAAVQDEIVALYNGMGIDDAGEAEILSTVGEIMNADASPEIIAAKAKLWVAYAVAIALLAIVAVPPVSEVYVALAVYELVVYAYATTDPNGSLEVDQLVDALASRLAD